MSKSAEDKLQDDIDDALDVNQAGVYRVYTEKKKFRLFEINHGRFFEIRDKWLGSYQVILRLLREVAPLAPGLLLLWTALKAWEGVETVLLGILESRVLRIIEHGISTRSLDSSALIMAVVSRLACVLLSAVITGPWCARIYKAITCRVEEYFDVMLYTVILADYCQHVPRVVEASNPHYLRMLAMKDLVDTKYRLDIISGNIFEYIAEQYKAAKTGLGDASTERPEWQSIDLTEEGILSRRGLQSILMRLLGELPMLYFVMTALLNPSSISLATLATVQASSNALQRAYLNTMYALQSLSQHTAKVQQLFEIQSVPKVVKDEGYLSYPPEEGSESLGMPFELRNVTFRYPGGKTITNALDDVSFKIGAGELVVVVGANGSGKSTFVNILSRLYDPTSGQVLVDGVDIKDYK
ncbi:hypothetical protein AAF712_015968, partial [Marasmius tenuissimus]